MAAKCATTIAWSEVSVALQENRCELVLTGAEIAKRVSEEGLDANIFRLPKLNYLEISRCGLVGEFPSQVGDLSHLTRLSVHSNRLASLPPSLSRLKDLKHLDASHNQLTGLPNELNKLEQLHSLNLSSNRIATSLPTFKSLVILDISHNEFVEWPESLLQSGMPLAELRARGNHLTDVPFSVAKLTSLRTLDVAENQIKTVAGELGDNAKLKEVFLEGNPLTDRRLLKTVENRHHKQIIEYIRAHCPRTKNEDAGSADSKKNKKNRKKRKETDEVDKVMDMLKVLHVSKDIPCLIVADAVKDIRPYIVCCLIKDVDLQRENNLKKFIAIQTQLHDNECKKRTAATIATHDWSKFPAGDLTYDARAPDSVKIVPLGRQKEVTARELFTQLQKDADALRKEKKRNTYSGIHKYLHLLEGQELFPCLLDSTDRVISLPPLTNSDVTKLSADSKHIFIEVTSNLSLTVCKEVMEALIRKLLTLDVYTAPDGEDENDGGRCRLVVQQLRVQDSQGNLRVVYPARPDLVFNDFRVIRQEDD